MKFIIEKVSNMVFISTDCGVIFNVWDESEFTERKLNNAMNKIRRNYNGDVTLQEQFKGNLTMRTYQIANELYRNRRNRNIVHCITAGVPPFFFLYTRSKEVKDSLKYF